MVMSCGYEFPVVEADLTGDNPTTGTDEMLWRFLDVVQHWLITGTVFIAHFLFPLIRQAFCIALVRGMYERREQILSLPRMPLLHSNPLMNIIFSTLRDCEFDFDFFLCQFNLLAHLSLLEADEIALRRAQSES